MILEKDGDVNDGPESAVGVDPGPDGRLVVQGDLEDDHPHSLREDPQSDGATA
jgi:hypothetical protein